MLIGRFRQFRFPRIKISVITMFMGAVYLCLFYILLHAWLLHKEKVLNNERMGVNLTKVVVHIDLKGSPPKLEYLTTLLPLFKEAGANALLMEYEDMFPYKGEIASLSSKYCYKQNELKNFITFASHIGFEIIPLVQTFGHLEHALKISKFKHLREIPIYPDSICPSKTGSVVLIKEMLEQVITFHSNLMPLKYIHVGCDEVFNINKCAQCRNRVLADFDIYLKHLDQVTTIVKTLSSNTTILFWDDMLRGISSQDWDNLNNFKGIEPVYWDYSPSLRVSHRNLYNYHKKFENIWIATAFKGAEGRTATVPNLINRFINHKEWMKLIIRYKFGGEKKLFNFKGIILTGWSRYSHMDPLCELLPVSIPSLVLNLLLIKRLRTSYIDNIYSLETFDFFNTYLKSDFGKFLQCDDEVYLDNFDIYYCKFIESAIYNTVEQYNIQNEEIEKKIIDVKEGINFLEYYHKINHLNMNVIPPTIKWCNESLVDLNKIQKRLSELMSSYYDDFVVDEYSNYRFDNLEKKLKKIINLLKNYYIIRNWPQRNREKQNTSGDGK